MPNKNQDKPINETPRFERLPFRCPRCKKVCANVTQEVIDGLVQLRCGDLLLLHNEMVCLHCGNVIFWHVRDQEIAKMAHSYKELASRFKPYAPE